ncbi:hypothetical protein TorRG33x02_258290 [Trema orientale]|uniref:Uncharacterized protein n=1 Tax=Trema orientale TaxID=63057 RepID=A0A2P5D9D2_TREOI|nr:hypothetical protein TorRG33x02_258290 [Trema orientale]
MTIPPLGFITGASTSEKCQTEKKSWKHEMKVVGKNSFGFNTFTFSYLEKRELVEEDNDLYGGIEQKRVLSDVSNFERSANITKILVWNAHRLGNQEAFQQDWLSFPKNGFLNGDEVIGCES